LLEQSQLELDAQDAPDGFVERLRGHQPPTHGVDQRFAVAVARRELDVDAGVECRHGCILDVHGEAVVVRELSNGEVVGDDVAIEPPLISEDRGEQVAVSGARDSVDLVVGVHHRLHAAEPDSGLERMQVHVAELAGRDPRRRPVQTTLRCAVTDEVLRGRDDT
jgi:hypothetical protein